MPNLIPLKEAREHLGVSKTTMAKLIREGRFTVYKDIRDGRLKLVDMAEVQAAMEPQPVVVAGQHSDGRDDTENHER